MLESGKSWWSIYVSWIIFSVHSVGQSAMWIKVLWKLPDSCPNDPFCLLTYRPQDLLPKVGCLHSMRCSLYPCSSTFLGKVSQGHGLELDRLKFKVWLCHLIRCMALDSLLNLWAIGLLIVKWGWEQWFLMHDRRHLALILAKSECLLQAAKIIRGWRRGGLAETAD